MERSRVLSNSSDGSSEGGGDKGFGAGHFLAGVPYKRERHDAVIVRTSGSGVEELGEETGEE